MTNLFRSTKARVKTGFTLIELLVVIAIIGVLASIVLASLNTARQKSRDSRRIAEVKQIQLALELYFDAQSPPQYPAAVASCNPATPAFFGLEVLAANNFMPQTPRDPNRTGTGAEGDLCYRYAAAAAGTRSTYHLGTVLEAANPALDSDRDCEDQAAAGAPICPTGAAATNGFDGNDADCNATAAAGTDRCYDVVP